MCFSKTKLNKIKVFKVHCKVIKKPREKALGFFVTSLSVIYL